MIKKITNIKKERRPTQFLALMNVFVKNSLKSNGASGEIPRCFLENLTA